ncbi:MAG: hypothetical protein JWP35_665 [Caulobacter sp.]|nr:hypothetical protein [Caulobacter sp.]
MKLWKTALCGAAASLALGSTAFADTTVAWNVGVATDYVFRGLDQTAPGSEGEAFGGVDVTSNALYGGVWVSNTGPTNDKGFEYDIYAGYKPVMGSVTLDLGAIFYGYTDSDSGFVTSDANMFELKAAATDTIGSGTIGAAVYYSPNFVGKANFDNGDASVYGELNAGYTFSNKATLSGAIGKQWVDDSVYSVDGYTTWNLGVTYPITDHVTIDVRYIGTDDDANGVGFGANTGVATLKASF